MAGPALAFHVHERAVYRATVFAVVWILAAAPSASLLCKFWCSPGDAPASACQHHQPPSSTVVNGDDVCGAVGLNVPSFIREEGPRAATASDAAQAVLVPRYRLVPPSSELRAVTNSANAWSLERGPLETTLRL
jgi:hypothetical protein